MVIYSFLSCISLAVISWLHKFHIFLANFDFINCCSFWALFLQNSFSSEYWKNRRWWCIPVKFYYKESETRKIETEKRKPMDSRLINTSPYLNYLQPKIKPIVQLQIASWRSEVTMGRKRHQFYWSSTSIFNFLLQSSFFKLLLLQSLKP